MTTPVDSFQDILDALERNPALRDQLRSHILTEELLQLPAQFLLLRADVDELKSGQTRLESKIGSMDERLGSVEERLGSMGERLGGVEGDVSSLKIGQEDLQRRMNRVEGRLGNIEGNQYEKRAVNRIIGRASRLDIEGAQVAFSKSGQARLDFYDAMAEAVQAGLISQDEYEDLTEADLIVRGRNRRHAVVEISLGPDENDLSRALRRSEILQRATGEHVSAVIAAPDPNRAIDEGTDGSNVVTLNISV